MRCLIISLALAIIVSSVVLVHAEDEFKPLFNGKDLEGWVGDTDLWKVEDGAIVGSTEEKTLKHNSFLATKQSYSDFVIKAKFKLRNHNSGIQFRSKQHDDFVVKGYQADMADNNYTGILYEEGGRGILANVKAEEVAKHYTKAEWSDYEITADGPHIVQKINGFTTIDYTEKDDVKGAKEGIIALQLHAGPKMRVDFKDIQIKELKKK